MKTQQLNRIVIVEDNPYMQEVIAQLVKKYTRRISRFSKGEDCINFLNKENADMIILDHYLEDDMNGIDVLKKIKSLNPDASVVYLSGQESLETALETLKYGAVDYIEKTAIGSGKLQQTIRKISTLKEYTKDKKITKQIYWAIALLLLGVLGIELAITFINPELFDM